MAPSEAMSKFGICKRTLYHIKSKKEIYYGMDRNRVSLDARGTFQAKYSELEARMTEFIAFAPDQHVPVSMHLIQERARMTAEIMGIDPFKASNGWLQNFLRRTSVQPSFKL